MIVTTSLPVDQFQTPFRRLEILFLMHEEILCSQLMQMNPPAILIVLALSSVVH